MCPIVHLLLPRGGNAAKQTLDAEVFVEFGPVNALAITEKLPA